MTWLMRWREREMERGSGVLVCWGAGSLARRQPAFQGRRTPLLQQLILIVENLRLRRKTSKVRPFQERWKRIGGTTVSFPLTPALSLGERETPFQRFVEVLVAGRSYDWNCNLDLQTTAERIQALPLPEGEGWGEGKQRVGLPSGNTPTEVWRAIKGFEPFIVSSLRLRRRELTYWSRCFDHRNLRKNPCAVSQVDALNSSSEQPRAWAATSEISRT